MDITTNPGSHHIYGKSDNPSRISVPIHKNKDIKVGLLRNLLKTAGLLETVFPENIKKNADEDTEQQLDVDEADY